MLTFIFKHPLVLALGVALVVLSLYLAWRKHQLILTGHLADGDVVELIPHRGTKGGTTYASRVAYQGASGVRTEFTTSYGSNPPMHRLGEKVRVIYYPGSHAPDIMTFAELFGFPWTLFGVGLFILGMCAGFGLGPGLIDATYLPRLLDR